MTTTTEVEIGIRVKRARRLANMGQTALAREMGKPWHQTTVWKVERGERRLTLSEAIDLCRILRVDISTFAADEDYDPYRDGYADGVDASVRALMRLRGSVS